MAASSIPFASYASAGVTTFRPGVLVYIASNASECNSGVRTPPPNGDRIVIGIG